MMEIDAGRLDIRSHETTIPTDGRDTGAPGSWKLIGVNVSHIDGGNLHTPNSMVVPSAKHVQHIQLYKARA